METVSEKRASIFGWSLAILILTFIIISYILYKKKGIYIGMNNKNDDKGRPDTDTSTNESESGYAFTGKTCQCEDGFGRVYDGSEILREDGTKGCSCAGYPDIYWGYPYWYGGVMRYRHPHRRRSHPTTIPIVPHASRMPRTSVATPPMPRVASPRPVAPMGGGIMGGGGRMGGGMMGGGGRGGRR